MSVPVHLIHSRSCRRTVWPGDLAPHHSYLGSSDLLLCAVDECDLLSKVEPVASVQYEPPCAASLFHSLGGLWGVNALDLDKRGVWVGVALASLVAEVLALDVESVSLFGWHGGRCSR